MALLIRQWTHSVISGLLGKVQEKNIIGEVPNFSERVRKHTMALVDELFTVLLMGSNNILNEHFEFKQNALHRVEQNTIIFLADTTV